MVLFVMPSLTALGGGIELYCRHFVEAVGLARPDLPLHALLGRESELRSPVAVPLSVSGASGTGRKLKMVAQAAAAARLRPMVVVCGHVNYAVLSALIARISGARLVTLLYGIEVWQEHSAATRRALGSADLTIAISSFTAAQALRMLPLAPERVMVVPNAVDTLRFTPGASVVEEALRHLPRPRLLTVARLDAGEAYKGVDQTLRALATLDKRPSYLVVGEGSDRPRLEALARELGVAAHFLGRAPDGQLADLYRACDLFVMPSRNEGFGYVFIEALACGVPVIAGSADGSVDAVRGGRLGRLVNPIDPREIAAAIVESLAAPRRNAEELHAEVAAHFGLPIFRKRVAEALDRLL